MSDVDFTHNEFETEGVKLHYAEAGQGPLVIFYHGFPLFWYSFHHQMTALKEKFRVVAVDGPGVNLSSKPDHLEPYKLKNLVKQLDNLANHLAPNETFHLVGHDWGGALSWSYAQQYPHRLNKVVAINAPPTNQLLDLLEHNTEQQKRSSYMWTMRSGQTFDAMTVNDGNLVWQNAYAGLRKLDHYSDKDDEIFRQGLAQSGAINGGINWYRANVPELGKITSEDYWPSKDAKTTVPGMLIWGDTDQTFVDTFIDDLPNYVTHLRVERIADIGHSPMLECPDKVNELLLEFLSS